MSTGGGARRNLGAKMDAEAARAAREGSTALELQPARHPNLELARRERDLLKEQLKGSPLKSGKVKQAEAALEERSRRQQALMDVATPAMGWAMQEGSAASTPPPPAAAATLQTSCCRRWKCCLQRQRHYTTTTADHYE